MIHKNKTIKKEQRLQLEDYKRILSEQQFKMKEQEETIKMYQDMIGFTDEHTSKQKQMNQDKYIQLKISYAKLKDKSSIKIKSLN